MNKRRIEGGLKKYKRVLEIERSEYGQEEYIGAITRLVGAYEHLNRHIDNRIGFLEGEIINNL